MTTLLHAQRFSLKSSLQEPADEWEAEIAGAAQFRATDENPDRRIDLEIGLLDGAGTPVPIGVLRNGVVDEWGIAPADVPGSKVSLLKGRDALALLIEGAYTGEHGPGEYASAVARAVAADADLDLVWRGEDYPLWAPLRPQARRIDVLYDLVRPFQGTEPFRFDITCQNGTVFVVQRSMALVPDFTYELRAAEPGPHLRILNVTVRRRRLPLWADVQVEGRTEMPTVAGPVQDSAPSAGESGTWTQTTSATPVIPTVDPVTGGVTFAAGEQTIQVGSIAWDPTTRRPIAQTLVTLVFQMPNQKQVRREIDTFAGKDGGLAFAKRERTETVYTEPFRYDQRGPVNDPPPFYEVTAVWKPVTLLGISLVEQTQQDVKINVFDRDQFLFLECTYRKEGVEESGRMVLKPKQAQVRLYLPVDAHWHVVIEDKYSFDERSQPILVSRETAPGQGPRPGGPSKAAGRTPVMTDLLPNILTPVTNTVTGPISLDVRAISPPPVRSEHLAQAGVDQVHGHYEAASGAIETEITFDALAMPWLRRGLVLKLTGYIDEDGDEIDLDPALIYYVKYDHEEAVRSQAQVRAVSWKAAA